MDEMACFDPEDAPTAAELEELDPADREKARAELERIISREMRVVEALVGARLTPHRRVRA